MSGRKPFKDLTKGWSPERKTRVNKKTNTLREELALADLRKILGVSQVELAERTNTSQSAIAQLEGRDDLHVSKLRDVVEALGGELDLTVRFPDGDVKLLGLGKNLAP